VDIHYLHQLSQNTDIQVVDEEYSEAVVSQQLDEWHFLMTQMVQHQHEHKAQDDSLKNVYVDDNASLKHLLEGGLPRVVLPSHQIEGAKAHIARDEDVQQIRRNGQDLFPVEACPHSSDVDRYVMQVSKQWIRIMRRPVSKQTTEENEREDVFVKERPVAQMKKWRCEIKQYDRAYEPEGRHVCTGKNEVNNFVRHGVVVKILRKGQRFKRCNEPYDDQRNGDQQVRQHNDLKLLLYEFAKLEVIVGEMLK
jgi:hypothetical protein